ncbi:hypothetical protein AUC61_10135 [Pseudomonas sp. S25]|uniref:Uncharacterized protein n=1 Tax=Pseudomonas maioricensis TaxID=1766623 RepID=A0ABS9ZH24_9PSED|nr:hypothetical protein [Pseudomonas sp. S25]
MDPGRPSKMPHLGQYQQTDNAQPVPAASSPYLRKISLAADAGKSQQATQLLIDCFSGNSS